MLGTGVALFLPVGQPDHHAASPLFTGLPASSPTRNAHTPAALYLSLAAAIAALQATCPERIRQVKDAYCHIAGADRLLGIVNRDQRLLLAMIQAT